MKNKKGQDLDFNNMKLYTLEERGSKIFNLNRTKSFFCVGLHDIIVPSLFVSIIIFWQLKFCVDGGRGGRGGEPCQ